MIVIVSAIFPTKYIISFKLILKILRKINGPSFQLSNNSILYWIISIPPKKEPPFFLFILETLSDYYYQNSPLRRREVFKGYKTAGVSNQSALQFLGGMEQNINFYANFIPVFDKLFISPLSDNGDNYYRYKVLDSQFVDHRRLIHLQFTPKRIGENT